MLTSATIQERSDEHHRDGARRDMSLVPLHQGLWMRRRLQLGESPGEAVLGVRRSGSPDEVRPRAAGDRGGLPGVRAPPPERRAMKTLMSPNRPVTEPAFGSAM